MAGLNLNRRVGESIVIGGNIVVKVKNIKDGIAELGIDAPRDVVVDRGEVHRKKELKEKK